MASSAEKTRGRRCPHPRSRRCHRRARTPSRGLDSRRRCQPGADIFQHGREPRFQSNVGLVSRRASHGNEARPFGVALTSAIVCESSQPPNLHDPARTDAPTRGQSQCHEDRSEVRLDRLGRTLNARKFPQSARNIARSVPAALNNLFGSEDRPSSTMSSVEAPPTLLVARTPSWWSQVPCSNYLTRGVQRRRIWPVSCSASITCANGRDRTERRRRAS